MDFLTAKHCFFLRKIITRIPQYILRKDTINIPMPLRAACMLQEYFSEPVAHRRKLAVIFVCREMYVPVKKEDKLITTMFNRAGEPDKPKWWLFEDPESMMDMAAKLEQWNFPGLYVHKEEPTDHIVEMGVSPQKKWFVPAVSPVSLQELQGFKN